MHGEFSAASRGPARVAPAFSRVRSASARLRTVCGRARRAVAPFSPPVHRRPGAFPGQRGTHFRELSAFLRDFFLVTEPWIGYRFIAEPL